MQFPWLLGHGSVAYVHDDCSLSDVVMTIQETELLETLRLPQNLRTLTVEPSSPDVSLPAALQRQMAVLPPAAEPDCCSRLFG